MNAKAYLSRVGQINARIGRKQAEIGMLTDLVTSTTAPMGRENIISSGNQDKFSSIMSKIADLETDIENLVLEKFEIIKTIEQIDDVKSFYAIYYRYVNEMNTGEIIDKMQISESRYYSKLSEGICEIEKILRKKSKLEKVTVDNA